MKYLDLSESLRASAVSLGCMRMAGKSEKEVDDVVLAALSLGIDHFDHADIYGGGRSEELFGEFLRRHPETRKNILIQTKCGIRRGQYDFSYDHIVSSVEGSLRRLGVEHIDILLLHRPDTLMEPEEVARAFDDLEKSGKVGAFGVSNHNPMQIELLKTAVRQPLIIDQLQLSPTEAGMFTSGMNVNMKNPESQMHDGSILEYARIKGITIQAWSPFQFGFFEGVYLGNRERFPALNETLDKLAGKYGITPAGVVTAFLLRHPAGIQMIAGTMDPTHLRQICAGADVVLSHSEWYEIYRAAGHCLP